MENTNNNPLVCFFDSGIGGLSLLYECVRILPRVDFTYFADNYRMPYGSLTHEKMLEYVDEAFSFIAAQNPAATVVACNTVTAQCVNYLRQKYKFNIVGIQPAIKPAAARGGKCLVLATPSTAQSQSLNLLAERYGCGVTEIHACPDLAAYIENNIANLSEKEVQKLLPQIEADSVVLGCTHYVFIKEIITDFYNCPVFDGIEGTAAHLAEILGIFDHRAQRGQKISFKGGDFTKNRVIFNRILVEKGHLSQNIEI
ncbi:MAG: glutamate racemase [Clostridia bacterium]|nr:glutamate racemase [Clostridia bacterium]